MLECIANLLTRDQVKTVVSTLKEAEFIDGRRTAGFRAKRVKFNEQLKRGGASREVADKLIIDALRTHPLVSRLAIPRKIQRPLFSRYREGMQYGLHVDDALMGTGTRHRTDISVTVFLNQPGDYGGGELEIESAFGAQMIKLPPGSAVIYLASTLHRVAEVTSGERLAAVTWIESQVRDPARREILADLDLIRRHLASGEPDGPETDRAFKTYANLLRIWAE